MKPKSFLALFCSFFSIAALSAQTTTSFRSAGMDSPDLSSIVQPIQENALWALLGMVVLMGLSWIVSVWKACAGLNKNAGTNRLNSLSVLLCVSVSLSLLGSGCTASQQARASELRAAQAAEGAVCVCHASHNNRTSYGYVGMSSQYPYNYAVGGTGKPFCRQCGQRIHQRNR